MQNQQMNLLGFTVRTFTITDLSMLRMPFCYHGSSAGLGHVDDNFAID